MMRTNINQATRVLIIVALFALASCKSAFYTDNDVFNATAELPQEEAPHFKNSLEWWYMTGHLYDTATNDEYGIEYVFFHFNQKGKRDLMMVNVAISDPKRQRFVYDYKVVPLKDFLLPELPIALSMKKGKVRWALSGQEGQYQLKANMKRNKGFGFDLTTTLDKPVLLHDGTGYEQYGDITKLGYYSYTRLPAKGSLMIDGKPVGVTGNLWYDRQWNCGSVGTLDYISWDWMAIQFEEDKTDLMVYLLKDYKGNRNVYGGTYYDAQGKAVYLSHDDIEIDELAYWTSPRSKGKYPTQWSVRIPSLGCDLTVQAKIPDQELKLNFLPGLSLSYWEGMCAVRGTRNGNPTSGRSYVEITNRTKLTKKYSQK